MSALRTSLLITLFLLSPPLLAADCVILLHGLARTSASLTKIATALESEGYLAANIGYDSRKGAIEELAPAAVETGLGQCRESGADRISFVTHSLGGILVRVYLAGHEVSELHRVVMLAPPNQGSAVVDVYRNVPGYRFLNGPAGLQLGTGADSIPLQLGPVDFDLGIIAGNRTINFILSQFLENPDDGKVSVANTRVEGMCGFIEMPVTHALMMRNDDVIDEIRHYLKEGIFSGDAAENNLC